ncbi:type II toxin-antitoxin system MqsA family antitoxin [Caldicellulosiruptor naganoensis]|uniref:Type II toxin-antitoxin system MqsA family antitoxin n=1 Tax=Caldicellulosiruptor naganoensis TaxID=29324 RepID=A0ABY7BGI0_9FIRM|nr:type II toxin-antitoxin system MqsA family antitoxin [Caldicellulosiruptor naganoensis]WAM31947.1 type II toxin-antitoxin system MqsA family antitoxin [Caldicellulosiruptor naganoensis]
MKCPLCRTEMKEGKIKHIVDVGNQTVIIKNVPALVCGQCGEAYLDDETALKLEKIVEELLKTKTEIIIANYSDIAA